jgi:hypothetical protein
MFFKRDGIFSAHQNLPKTIATNLLACIALNLTRHEQEACDPKKIENISMKICVGFDRS